MLFPLNLVLVLIKMALRKWEARFKVALFHCHGNMLHLEILEPLELNVRGNLILQITSCIAVCFVPQTPSAPCKLQVTENLAIQ